jgi:lysophospholipase L1-like esterase
MREYRVERTSLSRVRAMTAWLLSIALATQAHAQPPELPRVDLAIEDPSGHALDAIRVAFARAARGEGTARILFYGASHTSSDQFPGYLRTLLQSRLGDAGLGVALPVRPFTYYDHRATRFEHTGRWRTIRVRGRDRPPDIYGLLGVAVETAERASCAIEPRARTGIGSGVTFFEVFYLSQPRGGTFDVLLDGREVETVRTRAGRRELGYARIETGSDAPHRLEIRTRGDGVVRLFGVNMERDAPGVIVTPAGVPGARFRDQLPWNARAQAEHIRRIAPDLVVLGYGTNEAGVLHVNEAEYAREITAVIDRVRAAAPSASCLLIGASEWPELVGGEWIPRETTTVINRVQRAVAARQGCGFFDLVEFVGGPGNMDAWNLHDPSLVLDDHVHFTEPGHRVLAATLERALLGPALLADRRPR